MREILIKQIKFPLFSATFLFCLLCLSAGAAKAQSYGLTVFDYSVQGGFVIGTHETYLDYNASVRYAASVDGWLLNYNNDETLQNYQIVDYQYEDHPYDALVQTFGYVQRGKIYATYTLHRVIARFTYQNYFQDPYGLSRGYAETGQPTYGFIYREPAYTVYQRISVAATAVFVWLPNIQSLTVSSANTGATTEVEILGKYIGEHSLIPPDVFVTGSGVTVTFNRIIANEGVVVNVQIADDAAAGERQLSLKSGTAPHKVPSNSVPFTVVRTQPQINSISPEATTAGINAVVQFRGAFGPNPVVNVSGTGITTSYRGTIPDGFEANFQIDENATRGDRQVTVTQSGMTSNTVVFRVGDRSPVITGISRQQGETGEILGVTITGQNFGLNPQIQIEGGGINTTVQTQSPTQIGVTFAIGDNVPEGERGIKVKSLGVTGGGFTPSPGTSDTSNAVPFNVVSVTPTVALSNFEAVPKNGTIRPSVQVFPATNTRNIQLKISTISGTGQAFFTETGTDTLLFQQSREFEIKGLIQSSAANNIKLEAKFGNNVLASRNFSVVAVTSAIFNAINSPLDNNPGNGEIGSSLGQRIFPDRIAPSDAIDRTIVTVEAKVEPAVPNLRIYFANYDLDDPSANVAPLDPQGSAGDDNFGRIGTSSAGELSSPAGATCETWAKGVNCVSNTAGIANAQFKVTMNPGDNFTVAASLDRQYLQNIAVDTTDGTRLKDSFSQFVPITGEENSGSADSLAVRTRMLTSWRKIHLEVDTMDNPGTSNNVTGTISQLGQTTCPPTPQVPPCVVNTGFVVNTGTTPLEIGRFDNGRIYVGRRYFQVLTNIAGNQIILKGVPPLVQGVRIGDQFTLYDDDDFNNNDGVNKDGDENEAVVQLPDSLKLLYDGDGTLPDGRRNVYQSAYIRPEYNWAATRGYNQTNVGFDLNVDVIASDGTGTDELFPLLTNHRNSSNDEKDDFWIGYFVIAYQGALFEDADGCKLDPVTRLCQLDGQFTVPEPANPGIARLLVGSYRSCDCLLSSNCPVTIPAPVVCRVMPTGAIGAVLYQEAQQDVKRSWAAVGYNFQDIAKTAPHELGHQFGLAGDQVRTTFKLMDYSQLPTVINDVALHPEHVNIIRRRVKSPGQQ